MKYKCIKQFELPFTDEDGNVIESKYEIIPKGSIWEINNRTNIIDGEIHLDIVNDEHDFSWIEISEELFKIFFKVIG